MFIWCRQTNKRRKFVYVGWEIAFDGAASWSCGNDFDRNVVIFGVDNSSSSHTDNQKNNFWVFDEGSSTADINNSVGTAKVKIVLTLLKQTKNIFLAFIKVVMKVICVWVKQKFVNLRYAITYLGGSFVQEVCQKILQRMK